MNNASLELGGTNWAEKDASLLGYTVSDDSGRFSPQEFTFARGSNLAATRIDRAGLIEKGRENVLLQSNQFDTTWLTTRSSVTGNQSGYDGSNDAWKLVGTTPADGVKDHYLRQSYSETGVLTVSGYFKAAEKNTIRILFNNSDPTPRADFDLLNGSIHNKSQTIDASIVSVGNGWYRCSVTGILTVNALIQIYVTESINATAWVGDNTSGIYIQDAQLELGLAASPYIETTTTSAQAGVLENTPRLNYTTGVANPYLLLEPSRTNLYTYSEPFLGSGQTTNVSTYLNGDAFGIGVYGGFQLNAGSTKYYYGLSSAASTQYAVSFFVRRTDGGLPRIGTNSNDANGDFCIVASGSVKAPNDWDTTPTFTLFKDDVYKFEGVLTTPALTDNFGHIKYTGNSAIDVQITGLQLEAAPYPTSYIPTYSVSATRAADNCNKTNASGVIGQTEGTLFAEIQGYANALSGNSFLSLTESTGNNRLLIGQSSSINQLRVFIDVGTVANGFNYSVTDITQPQKIAIVYSNSGNTIAIYVNGVKETGYAVGDTFSALLTDIAFDNGASGQDAEFNVNELQVYKEALTDAEAITLTTI